jgi:alginate O-acetyltransferase complex protein AlgI
VPALSVILPVGISFYTFRTMSYTIDIDRGQFLPTRNFVDSGRAAAFCRRRRVPARRRD